MPRKKRQHPPSKSCEQLKVWFCGDLIWQPPPAGLRRRLRRFGLFWVVFFFGTSLLKVQLPPPPQKPSKKGFFSKKSSNERPANLSLVVKGHYWWPLCYWSCLKIRKKGQKKAIRRKKKVWFFQRLKAWPFLKIEDRDLIKIKNEVCYNWFETYCCWRVLQNYQDVSIEIHF